VRHSPGVRRVTLGCDKGYDAASFVAAMRALNVTPHIAQNISGWRSAIDSRRVLPTFSQMLRRTGGFRSGLKAAHLFNCRLSALASCRHAAVWTCAEMG
jgi:hypothetical protein